jgi:hypothetical protein
MNTSPVYATQPHPKCSPNYQFISTADVVSKFEDKGFHISSVQFPKARNGTPYGTHMVRMDRSTDNNFDLGLTPQVVIINSHDRTKAFRVGLGFKIWACLNGLLTGDMLVDSGKLYHTGKGLSERVTDYLDVHTKNMNEKIGSIRDMRTMFLNDDSITDLTVKAADIINPKMTNPYELIYANREDAMGRDLWTLFNNLQENAMKGNFSILGTTPDKWRKARPVRNVKRDIEVNAKLWNLAESFVTA